MAQINKPTEYFNTLLWTGNSTDNRVITGVGFQPDLVWFKQRTGANVHAIIDSVRGTAGTNYTLSPNNTNAEFDWSGIFKDIQSDGYTVGTDTAVNSSGNNYVGWNWLASNTTASNTDGSITSTVSANTTSGFSIVTWTGNATASQSVGHGLGAVPKVILTKNTDNGTQPWKCYFSEVGNDKYLQLNTSDVPATSGVWSNTTPSSSLIYISNDTGVNGSGNTILAYCFAEKKGFSKAFSYTGNGSTDGSFCYLGFRPAFILLKNADRAENWFMFDNKRDTYNVADAYLNADASTAETTLATVDFLSNGFKIRTSGAYANFSGSNIIGIAFAENPLVSTAGVPCTAR